MSELKADNTFVFGEECLAYKKEDADKVIAELKEKRDTAEKLLNKALDCVSNGKNHMMSLARKNNHANYKRCLAMANGCEYLCAHYQFREVYKKRDFFRKWIFRWFAIAEKFKEAK